MSFYLQATHKQLRAAVKRECNVILVHVYCQPPCRGLDIMGKNVTVELFATHTLQINTFFIVVKAWTGN